jgi:hypothetical protein
MDECLYEEKEPLVTRNAEVEALSTLMTIALDTRVNKILFYGDSKLSNA